MSIETWRRSNFFEEKLLPPTKLGRSIPLIVQMSHALLHRKRWMTEAADAEMWKLCQQIEQGNRRFFHLNAISPCLVDEPKET